VLAITSAINHADFSISSHLPLPLFPKPKSPNTPCVRKIKKRKVEIFRPLL